MYYIISRLKKQPFVAKKPIFVYRNKQVSLFLFIVYKGTHKKATAEAVAKLILIF